MSALQNVTPVEKPFQVNSIHGGTKILQKCPIKLFNETSFFFILPSLKDFDGIVGLDLLMQVDAKLDFNNGIIRFKGGTQPLNFKTCPQVNFTQVNDSDVPSSMKESFDIMIKRRSNAFADPNESLPYNINTVATIRTNDEPVYSKLYPYPMGVADFVNSEVKQLLDNGIIRPSRSPYNNPIWVVDKKGVDELGHKKKRMVIDFRKLNEKTVSDKYPIPNISAILANMGEAQYFTTLDLKSGFHQIELAERDREKTAFSVNNGKYEFCRLPFGLKNAPSIFQRAIDDVLRDEIGKTCHVYVDDVIIFSTNKEDHVKHINWVLKSLEDANMRVSQEKSKFFKKSVEYLGFTVSRGGIQTSPEKVQAIKSFQIPKTLFGLRSFLGLANYYRCFIKGFADIARPLTDVLKGENGKISANQSRKVVIELTQKQIEAFCKLRDILASEDVVLRYPDFKKPFDLTTDASGYGIGAVLSQEGRPITLISRALRDNEQNLATNERELLAIVWALKNLRNYLYGVRNLNIFTDHQPLTYAVSDKNPNAKIKRWKAFIDEHNANIIYKPGKENYVADALSRQNVNALDSDSQCSDIATIHSEESLTYTIETTDKPVNCFRNQIIIEESHSPFVRTIILFQNKTRHIVGVSDRSSLLQTLQDVVNAGVVNGIHCELPILAFIQHNLIELFPSTTFRYCKYVVTDIPDKTEQREIVTTEHNRAHRAAQENVKQIMRDYFFPNMSKLATEIVANCRICSMAKYDRHPKKQMLGETPIPTYAGERLHIDVFSTDQKFFLTCVDKFSKFAVTQPIGSRAIIDIKNPILQLINFFPNINTIYCDNERSLNSETVKSILCKFDIQIVNTPPLHSVSNGQVERFHSTLAEIARCMKLDKHISDTVDLILLSTIEYNKTIHSVTAMKPVDVICSSSTETGIQIRDRLIKAQSKKMSQENKNRENKEYLVGDKVWVKSNRRLGNKLTPLCVEGIVEADLGSTVLIKGRVVHKDNLRK